ncbi:hypothetical protein GGE12_000283 [Rhizobium mongolense]|uniref:Uncharacterized protein n=1 Tax=Rhizobium mongolense TaxID=57676 RepID=A0A7W6WC19_9HYPH|nr:hypothetical protein [Rhizobium mongolense]
MDWRGCQDTVWFAPIKGFIIGVHALVKGKFERQLNIGWQRGAAFEVVAGNNRKRPANGRSKKKQEALPW